MSRTGQALHSRSEATSSAGFSLVELLMAIFIISVLVILLITALEPEKHFAAVRNRTRQQHVNLLVTAIADYAEEEDASFLSTIPVSAPLEICSAETPADCAGLLSLVPLLGKGYLSTIPRDPGLPDATSAEHAGYTAQRLSGQHIRIAAPLAADDGETVEMSL